MWLLVGLHKAAQRLHLAAERLSFAAWVASLAPGPAIPSAEQLDFADADVAEGGVLFRINCAQCHQAAGGGGALTQGKYAPSLMDATPQEIYEAMLTGPQNMPVFSDETLPVEEKQRNGAAEPFAHLERHTRDEPKVEVRQPRRRARPAEEPGGQPAQPRRRARLGAEQVAAVRVGVHVALVEHLGERRLDAEADERQLRRRESRAARGEKRLAVDLRAASR